MTKLTQQIVRELISYDPETGVARWKPRDAKWFKEGKYVSERSWKIWNTRFSGNSVGSLNGKGYKETSIFHRRYLLHRIIWIYMTGEWRDQVDHIDGDRSNNKWSNLRNVDKSVNNKNIKTRSDNKSGTMGVFWNKWINKWQAYINVDGRRKYLGCFANKQQAIDARKETEIEFGFHQNHGRE